MHQSKTIITAFLALLVLLGGVYVWQMNLHKQEAVRHPQSDTDTSKDARDSEKVRLFVTDVDPDVSHWQTKETEFFTIKFPKEWYWLDSNITNNPKFQINKDENIGLFSGIGPTSPLQLLNDREVLITHRGTPTSDAGTPTDSLNSIFELAKYNYPSVKCVRLSNNHVLPLIASCNAVYENHQAQQSYYVINEKISLTITMRTMSNSPIEKSILEKIAKNIVLK